MLDKIFEMQTELNDYVFAKNKLKDKSGQDLSMKTIMTAVTENKLMVNDLPNEWLMNYSKAMKEELIELDEELLWKWWSKDEIDMQNIRVELIDILHFLVSAMMCAGLNADKQKIQGVRELRLEEPHLLAGETPDVQKRQDSRGRTDKLGSGNRQKRGRRDGSPQRQRQRQTQKPRHVHGHAGSIELEREGIVEGHLAHELGEPGGSRALVAKQRRLFRVVELSRACQAAKALARSGASSLDFRADEASDRFEAESSGENDEDEENRVDLHGMRTLWTPRRDRARRGLP